MQQRMLGLEAQKAATEIGRTQAEIYKNYTNPFGRPIHFKDANGTEMLLGPDGSARPIPGQAAPQEQITGTEWIPDGAGNDVLHYRTRSGLRPAVNPDTNKPYTRPTPEHQDFVNVPGYGRMPAGAAYSAGRQAQGQAAADTNKQNAVDYENAHAGWREASDAVSRYNTSYSALQRNIASAKALSRNVLDLEGQMKVIESKGDPNDPNDSRITKAQESQYRELQGQYEGLMQRKAQIEEENQRLVDETNSLGADFNGRHRAYVTQLPNGSFQVRPEPKKPDVVRRQSGGRRGTAPSNDPLGLFER